MFDRTTLAFKVKDKVQMLPLAQLQYAINNNFVTPETVYFNNLVQTKEELENKWLIPVKDSWLREKSKLKYVTANISCRCTCPRCGVGSIPYIYSKTKK